MLSSSHLGHRLTAYAQEHKPEVEGLVAMELMNNYQVKGKSPSDRDELARIAQQYGLFADEGKAKAWLASDDKDALVKKQYEGAMRKGITGVPFFVFDDKLMAAGAVGVDEFERAIGTIVG